MLSSRIPTVLTFTAENCSLHEEVLQGDEKERIEREGRRRMRSMLLEKQQQQCHDFSGLANSATTFIPQPSL
jgi:hypothetical protein